METPPPPQDAPLPGTQVIQRVAALLRLLTMYQRTGMRLIDLHRGAGIERSTAHRLLQGLIAERLVTQDHASKRYRLGPAIYEMGLAAAPSQQLRDVCHRHLLSLAEQTGDTVFLTLRSGFDAVCVDRVEGAYPIKAFVLDVGRRRPLNIGAGALAIMSRLSDAEIARITAANKGRLAEQFPMFTEAAMQAKIDRARRTGLMINDVLEVAGVRAIGMPIIDAENQPVAAISVSALTARLEAPRLDEVAMHLGEAIRQVEAELRG